MNIKVSSRKRYHRSSQREAILAVVRQTDSHPTAEEIYARLKRRFPRLSLGTVYRNLHILAELGELHEIHFGSGRDRFDANTNRHYHFVCRRCEELIDLDMSVHWELEEEAGRAGSFRVEGHSVEFHGLCASCLRAESGS